MEFERYRKFKWNVLIKLHRPEDSFFSNTVSPLPTAEDPFMGKRGAAAALGCPESQPSVASLDFFLKGKVLRGGQRAASCGAFVPEIPSGS